MNKITVFFRKNGHRVLTFSIGLVFLAACAAGLFFAGRKIYRRFRPADIYMEGVDPELIAAGAAFDELRAQGLKEDSEEFLNQYIANFIAQDFPSFTDPVGLNTDYFISYGIWQAIKVNGQGVYTERNGGGYLIPKADVEKFGLYNFNYAGKIKHRSVDICGKVTFDKASGCYRVGADVVDKEYMTPAVEHLVPKILEIKKAEDTGYITLLVDCYYSDPLTETDVTQDATRFAKRVSIVLRPVEMAVGESLDQAEGESAEIATVTDYQYVSGKPVDATKAN